MCMCVYCFVDCRHVLLFIFQLSLLLPLVLLHRRSPHLYLQKRRVAVPAGFDRLRSGGAGVPVPNRLVQALVGLEGQQNYGNRSAVLLRVTDHSGLAGQHFLLPVANVRNPAGDYCEQHGFRISGLGNVFSAVYDARHLARPITQPLPTAHLAWNF